MSPRSVPATQGRRIRRWTFPRPCQRQITNDNDGVRMHGSSHDRFDTDATSVAIRSGALPSPIVTAITGGTVEVVTTVASRGEFTSCRYEEVGSDCYAVPGLDVDVIAPLERLGFRYQGLGFRGVDAEGFPATRRREVAD